MVVRAIAIVREYGLEINAGLMGILMQHGDGTDDCRYQITPPAGRSTLYGMLKIGFTGNFDWYIAAILYFIATTEVTCQSVWLSLNQVRYERTYGVE